MTLDEYDQRMDSVVHLEAEEARIAGMAVAMRDKTYRDAGLDYAIVDGWARWFHPNLSGRYNTPREVIVALEKKTILGLKQSCDLCDGTGSIESKVMSDILIGVVGTRVEECPKCSSM